MRGRRGFWAGLALTVLSVGALAVPALASAVTTYCVPGTTITGCPAGATPKLHIADALAAVNSHIGVHDTILIVTVSTPSTATNATAVVLSGAASFTLGNGGELEPRHRNRRSVGVDRHSQ
ncbi:MAG: hypothetical protein M3Z27_03745 [Actinomycetota bacterium]|nr:hypothetical protein [Actinomycetota bacterium]